MKYLLYLLVTISFTTSLKAAGDAVGQPLAEPYPLATENATVLEASPAESTPGEKAAGSTAASATVAGMGADGAPPSARPDPAGGVGLVIPVKGPISDAMLIVLRRALKNAEQEGKTGVILDMDTPGGALDTTVKISEALGKTSLTTVTYVNPSAFSAGALIAMSTDQIYMAPVSAIGAAAVVMSGGQDAPQTMSEKVTSGYSAHFRSVAETKGHNPDIATAFMDKNKEVKIGDTVISEAGSLLSFSAQEASRIVDERPVLALGIAKDLTDVAAKVGFESIETFQPAGFEQFSLWLTAIAPLLLTVGLIAGYLEFKTPGFGIPGAIAAVAFTLFFTSHYFAGLAGMELLVLFFLGFALVLVEVLFFPGTIIPAMIGVLLIVGTLLFAMADHYPSQPVIPESFAQFQEMLLPGATTLTSSALIAGIGILIIGKFFPSTPGVKHLILNQRVEAKGASPVPFSAGVTVEVGALGKALTPLVPGGKVLLGDVTADAMTQGEFLPRDAAIRVIRLDGASVIVAASES